MHDELLWISTNSNGGITYYEAYHMPVPIRRYNISKLIEIITKKNNSDNLSIDKLPKKRDINIDYAAKLSPKK